METERAFGYDMGTANDFFGTVQLLARAGHARPKASFIDRIEAMYNYGTFASDQLGYGPRSGDADLGKAGWVQSAYEYFGRAIGSTRIPMVRMVQCLKVRRLRSCSPGAATHS